MTHREAHAAQRIGWLRAAILGANDGIVSTASLIAGVAAAGAAPESILVTGVAGLVAGAMSMAAGEYVSVSSQGDAEKADIARERHELKTQPDHELEDRKRDVEGTRLSVRVGPGGRRLTKKKKKQKRANKKME